MTSGTAAEGRTDYFDERNLLSDRVRHLESALRDIAGSEPIPTPSKGWEFCRDVAIAALAKTGGAS